jgi:hypothetical protein
VDGVSAAENYGDQAFCDSVNLNRPTIQLHCLPVTDQMLAYERARRAVGEVCLPDGTLAIATRATRALSTSRK